MIRMIFMILLLLALSCLASGQCQPNLTPIFPGGTGTTVVTGTLIIRFEATPTCNPIVQTQAHLFGYGTCGLWPDTCIGIDLSYPYAILWDTSTSPNGFNNLFIEASDRLDNARGVTLDVDIQNPMVGSDTKSPESFIQFPAIDGYQIPNGRNGAITVESLNADNSGVVTRVDFLVNGSQAQTAFTAPFAFNWKPKQGAYKIQLRAWDQAGNSGLSQIVSVNK